MSSTTHHKRTSARAKGNGPIVDKMRKIEILSAEGKTDPEIAREIGVDPPNDPPSPPRSRWSPSKEKAQTDSHHGPTILLASEIKPSKVQWLWHDRIPLGKLTVLDGDPGLGKSLLSLDIAARVTTARPMPDGTCSDIPTPAGVLIWSAEDDVSDTIRPRLEAASVDISRIAFPKEVLPFITDLTNIRASLRQVDARLMIIDPFMAFLPSTVNSHRDQDVRSVIAPLAALVAELGVALLIIRHLNKAFMPNALYRGGGSIGIAGAARSGLLVARDPGDPAGKTHILVATKANLAPLPPALAYRIDTSSTGVPAISWHGETQHTAAALLAQQEDDGARSALEDAIGFLTDILADGPVPAKEIRQESGQAGVASRTLDRAKSKLGIKARKVSKAGSRNQQWVWGLPQADSAPPKYAKNGEERQERHT